MASGIPLGSGTVTANRSHPKVVCRPPGLQRPLPLLHRLYQLPRRQVPNVAIGYRQRSVAELCLDNVQRPPFVSQLEGVRVAKPMGVDPFRNARALRARRPIRART